MRVFFKLLLLISLLIGTYSCGQNPRGNRLTNVSTSKVKYEDTDVNAIDQALPSIVVIPSDNLLKSNKCIQVSTDPSGNSVPKRDFQKFFLVNKENKSILSAIQNEFVKLGFPIQDLEQSLKQLENNKASDLADDLAKDSKTIILSTIRPDIIVELDYDFSFDMLDSSVKRHLSYTMNFIDAYTNKVFSTRTANNLNGDDLTSMLSSSITKEMKSISPEIQNYFADILYKGREVTLRVVVSKNCPFNLSDESIYGDTYADWIIDYVKTHAKKGTYNLQRNSNFEMYFINVRINTINDDGTQYGVYDWARDLIKALRKDCGVKCSNKSQGLGEIVISITGM